MEMSQLTFYFPSLAVAVLGHVKANTILHSRRLNVKGACVHTQNVKLTAGTYFLQTNWNISEVGQFFFFPTGHKPAHPSVCEEQRAPGTG